MKNIIRILTIVAAAGVLAVSVSSCGEKFLNEVQRTKVDSGFLDTPEGLYSMSQSLYLQFRQMYYTESWPFTNAGTDEFMIGGDGASESGPIDLSRDTIADNIYYEVKEFLDLVEHHIPESSENSWSSSLIQAQICSR